MIKTEVFNNYGMQFYSSYKNNRKVKKQKDLKINMQMLHFHHRKNAQHYYYFF